MKNPYGKMKPKDDPYVSFSQDGWTWHVLKIYKSPTSSINDPYSRAYCFVTSPFCPGGEYGDVYVRDIPRMLGWLREGGM